MPTERHSGPPQSIDVSCVSCKPLLHTSVAVSARQRLVAESQRPVVQSEFNPQALPIGQRVTHVLPPQSMPVSSPSNTPLLHDTQVLVTGRQSCTDKALADIDNIVTEPNASTRTLAIVTEEPKCSSWFPVAIDATGTVNGVEVTGFELLS